ncbi:MAG TPA: DUF1080 domain-containing protein [Ohtaekwangia sp.]
MNKFLVLLICIGLTMACKPKQAETEQTNDTTTATTAQTEPAINQLTETEKSAGWKLLFDGQSLNGWKFFKDMPNDSWEVVDGTLHCKPFADDKENNKRADIMTVDQYENFELAFGWKIGEQGNSGVMFRVIEQYDEPYLSGPEYQVMDMNAPGDIKDVHKTGANYDMHAAVAAAPNPTGEWNESRLVVNGDHVEHWLNGVKVVEYELNSADWKKRKEAGKWKDAAGYGASKKGYIDFQDHKQEAWFRNIKIRTL